MGYLSGIHALCATHRDLNARMVEEAFRSDLYYRLLVHQVELPPLRVCICRLRSNGIERVMASTGRKAVSSTAIIQYGKIPDGYQQDCRDTSEQKEGSEAEIKKRYPGGGPGHRIVNVHQW